jgi:hypothetical protein
LASPGAKALNTFGEHGVRLWDGAENSNASYPQRFLIILSFLRDPQSQKGAFASLSAALHQNLTALAPFDHWLNLRSIGENLSRFGRKVLDERFRPADNQGVWLRSTHLNYTIGLFSVPASLISPRVFSEVFLSPSGDSMGSENRQGEHHHNRYLKSRRAAALPPGSTAENETGCPRSGERRGVSPTSLHAIRTRKPR